MNLCELIKNGNSIKNLLHKSSLNVDISKIYFILPVNNTHEMNLCIHLLYHNTNNQINTELLSSMFRYYDSTYKDNINVVFKYLPSGLEIELDNKFTYNDQTWYYNIDKTLFSKSLGQLKVLLNRNKKIDKLINEQN